MPKKQTEWTRAYNERAYARISVTIPKDKEAAVKAHAEKRGLSVNGLINELLRTDMELTVEQWKGKESEPKQEHLIFHVEPRETQTERLIFHLDEKPEPKQEPIVFTLKKEE